MQFVVFEAGTETTAGLVPDPSRAGEEERNLRLRLLDFPHHESSRVEVGPIR